jgi:hypothetical protein
MANWVETRPRHIPPSSRPLFLRHANLRNFPAFLCCTSLSADLDCGGPALRLTTRLFVPFVMTVVSDAAPELGLDIARLLRPFFLRASTNQIFSGHAPSAHANSRLRLADASLRMRRLPRAAACPTWPVVFLELWASDRSDRICFCNQASYVSLVAGIHKGARRVGTKPEIESHLTAHDRYQRGSVCCWQKKLGGGFPAKSTGVSEMRGERLIIGNHHFIEIQYLQYKIIVI